MKVKVDKKMYSMPKARFKQLLSVASEQVPFGIYAVEKGQYAEMRNDKCKSMTELKALTRMFKLQGFKVYANK